MREKTKEKTLCVAHSEDIRLWPCPRSCKTARNSRTWEGLWKADCPSLALDAISTGACFCIQAFRLSKAESITVSPAKRPNTDRKHVLLERGNPRGKVPLRLRSGPCAPDDSFQMGHSHSETFAHQQHRRTLPSTSPKRLSRQVFPEEPHVERYIGWQRSLPLKKNRRHDSTRLAEAGLPRLTMLTLNSTPSSSLFRSQLRRSATSLFITVGEKSKLVARCRGRDRGKAGGGGELFWSAKEAIWRTKYKKSSSSPLQLDQKKASRPSEADLTLLFRFLDLPRDLSGVASVPHVPRQRLVAAADVKHSRILLRRWNGFFKRRYTSVFQQQ